MQPKDKGKIYELHNLQSQWLNKKREIDLQVIENR